MSSELDPSIPIRIPFVVPVQTGTEGAAIEAALRQRRLAGDNPASRSAEAYLREAIGVEHALLTPSGTAALELACLLLDLAPGDEVIMPSFTFSSTANAVVLRGAVPVFIDVRADTLNIDETLIPAAITERTRAIMVVHYAGVPCAMEPINRIAAAAGLVVVEDAAQALHSTYRGTPAGALGAMAAFSFHETKNIHSGEGGAFTCHDSAWGKRAEIIREKGTNRAAFFRGEIDKYTWVDIGSSFLPSELGAAFLGAQLQQSREITVRRLEIWSAYHAGLAALALSHGLGGPGVPEDCRHNGHIYYLLAASGDQRGALLRSLRTAGIQATSHYVPLHASPAGRRLGRVVGSMTQTDRAGDCLLRLPLWPEMSSDQVEDVIRAIHDSLD